MQTRRAMLLAASLLVLPLQSVSGQDGNSLVGHAIDGVSYEELLHTDENPGSWLTYSGGYNGQRFSRLDQINSNNANRLRLKWAHQIRSFEKFETSPLVVDGVMFGTGPRNEAFAMDPATGHRYWTYMHPQPEDLRVCCGQVNRGFGMLGETLFMGTLDCRMVALDAKSGRVKWNVKVADYATGHSITGAPLVVKDLVITGVGGGEYGIRGFLDAYDAETGERRWRLYTIPAPGEPGNETWAGDSWKIGGTPTWMTGSYDPELNLVYWGTGNPGPDWNGEVREGDNLYSDCVLAIDADTGELKWHFQFTPHDVHDWDATQVPVLVDAPIGGKQRKLLVFGNRNAWYYVLDRVSGEFITGVPYAKQDWAERLDEHGRPIRVPGKLPSEEGTLVYPDIIGAVNWYPPAYSPITRMFYINAYDGAGKVFISEAKYEPGQQYTGGFGTFTGTESTPENDDYTNAIRALDVTTGERKWQYLMAPRCSTGLLATAGNLVFGGTADGYIFALDATTGDELWKLGVGGNVASAPVTYLVDGQQQVTIAAGNSLLTFAVNP